MLEEIHMKDAGLNQTDLATAIGCTHAKVNSVINGKRSITPDFAIDLERVLGTSAEVWLRLQAKYDLWLARKKKSA